MLVICHEAGDRQLLACADQFERNYKCQFMFSREMILFCPGQPLSLRKDIGTFHHILFLSKIWCHNWFLIHRIFSEKKISISAFPRDWADVEPVFHLKERIFFKKENAVMLSFHFIFTINILSFSWLLRMRSCPSVVICTMLSYILTSYQSWWTRLMTTLIWCSVFHQSTVHLNGNLFIWF